MILPQSSLYIFLIWEILCNTQQADILYLRIVASKLVNRGISPIFANSSSIKRTLNGRHKPQRFIVQFFNAFAFFIAKSLFPYSAITSSISPNWAFIKNFFPFCTSRTFFKVSIYFCAFSSILSSFFFPGSLFGKVFSSFSSAFSFHNSSSPNFSLSSALFLHFLFLANKFSNKFLNDFFSGMISSFCMSISSSFSSAFRFNADSSSAEWSISKILTISPSASQTK